MSDRPPFYYERPRKGNLIFRDDLPDRQNNISLKRFGDGGRQLAYAEGYQRAAKLLVEHVVERGGHGNFLVFPIIFLYRHHLELALKRIIGRVPSLLHRPLTKAETKHIGEHSLEPLWQDVKPLLREIYRAMGEAKPELPDVEGAEDFIHQLENLDPDSFHFRYEHSKSGNPYLSEDLRFNIRHFGETIERLVKYVDDIDTMADAVASLRDDMRGYGI